LFSFQRSNIQFSAVFHVVVVSAATFIIYHVEVLFASIFFDYFQSLHFHACFSEPLIKKERKLIYHMNLERSTLFRQKV